MKKIKKDKLVKDASTLASIYFKVKEDFGINNEDNYYLYELDFEKTMKVIRKILSLYGEFDMTDKDLYNFLVNFDILDSITSNDEFEKIAKEEFLDYAKEEYEDMLKSFEEYDLNDSKIVKDNKPKNVIIDKAELLEYINNDDRDEYEYEFDTEIYEEFRFENPKDPQDAADVIYIAEWIDISFDKDNNNFYVYFVLKDPDNDDAIRYEESATLTKEELIDVVDKNFENYKEYFKKVER